MKRPVVLSSRNRGFTLFELIMVIIIVAVLAGTLLTRLLLIQELVEKVAMEQTIAAAKSGLQLQTAALLVRSQERQIEGLAKRNPFDFLAEKPYNYAGAYSGEAAIARVSRGSWYFDAKRGEIVYLVNRDEHFRPGADGRKWVRYKTIIDHEDDAGGGPEQRRKMFSAIRLVAINGSSWGIDR